MPQLTFQDVQSLIGANLIDAEGSKVGKIEDIYLDNETQEPEWALVHTGLLGRKLHYVPLRDASLSDDSLQAAYVESQIKEAPSIDPDVELSPEEEADLYQHYGVEAEPRVLHAGDAGEAEQPVASDTGYDTSGPTTDDAMTRSEEQFRVGVVRRPSSLVRLKKYIVTEDVQMTVPVQREEIRVVREPITDANVGAAMDGPELSDEEHEMALVEEQVVVDKVVVPKERVRLDKSVTSDEQVVSEQVRREQIDMEQE
ncbi:MAG: PRC and DUF2382 domain-containing protein [Actinomycetota bacterium]|nr:PRC and DUF2382 domain-containing protein [Actinomycetota bacterium]